MPQSCSFLKEDIQAFLVEEDTKAFLKEGIQVMVQILEEHTAIAKKEELIIINMNLLEVGIKAGNFTVQKERIQIWSQCYLLVIIELDQGIIVVKATKVIKDSLQVAKTKLEEYLHFIRWVKVDNCFKEE